MPRTNPETRYHHGDLRSALVGAAEALMVERSDWTFTLREVARAAGVSHNAPYNHFPDRRALLAAIAARAFDDLTASLRRHLDGIDGGDVAEGIRATGRAYAGFAVAHPSRFRLMFSAELTGCDDAVFRAAGQGTFAVLSDLIARGVAEGRLRADSHGTHAIAAWSLVHGLSTLVLDGRVPAAASAEDVATLADGIAATLLEGLAIP